MAKDMHDLEVAYNEIKGDAVELQQQLDKGVVVNPSHMIHSISRLPDILAEVVD